MNPPPVPVASITGVFIRVVLPKFSATEVEKGYTVEEPTMRIWSRASAPAVRARNAADAAAMVRKWFIVPPLSLSRRNLAVDRGLRYDVNVTDR